MSNDIDVIRRRPSMYIGDVCDGSGLAHMVWELLANALDEHLGGFCREISITINEDGSVTVRDNGRGIPTHDIDGVPFAQRVLTSRHHTPTFDGHAPHEHVGLLGVGVVAVNALSSWLEVEIRRDGRLYRQRYEHGVPCGALAAVDSTRETGTSVTFLPDVTVFSETWINAGTISIRLREIACLLPSVTLAFADRRKHEFHEADGLRAFLVRTRSPRERVWGAVLVRESVGDIGVEAALEWRNHQWSSIDSYANIERTTSGGTHVQGLLNGLALALRDVEGTRVGRRSLKQLRDIVACGLHAVVCVRLRDPTFDQPTRSRLATPAVTAAVSAVIRHAFSNSLRDNLDLRQRFARPIEGGST